MTFNLVCYWPVFGIGKNIKEHRELAIADSDTFSQTLIHKLLHLFIYSLDGNLVNDFVVLEVDMRHSPMYQVKVDIVQLQFL